MITEYRLQIDEWHSESDLHRRSLNLPYTAEYQAETEGRDRGKGKEPSSFVTLTLSLSRSREREDLD
jgi:hypothetical protein